MEKIYFIVKVFVAATISFLAAYYYAETLRAFLSISVFGALFICTILNVFDTKKIWVMENVNQYNFSENDSELFRSELLAILFTLNYWVMDEKLIMLSEKLSEKFGIEKMCAIIGALSYSDILKMVSELWNKEIQTVCSWTIRVVWLHIIFARNIHGKRDI